MSPIETLRSFAAEFVNPEFRERFEYEAFKKPRKLHQRVCHRIEQLFPLKYKDGAAQFKLNDRCLVLFWGTEFQEMSWGEASKKMGNGGGLLVIENSGAKFYAETEGSPKCEVWSGEL